MENHSAPIQKFALWIVAVSVLFSYVSAELAEVTTSAMGTSVTKSFRDQLKLGELGPEMVMVPIGRTTRRKLHTKTDM